MCQVLILTNTDQVKNQQTMINTIAKHLQKTQKDGFGYAIQGKSGVFGERTTSETFKSRVNSKLTVGSKFIEVTYNSFGKPSSLQGAGIFHGRTSTNHKSLINTHPISKNGWHLIHNGVVSNHGPTYEKQTTNDTEDVVHYLSTTGISGVEKYLSGYYAVGAIDTQGQLHVIKDSSARLFIAFNKTLDCLVFGTTEELITKVAKDLSWTIGPIDQVKNDIHLIFNKSGDLVHSASIKPLGYTRYETQYADKSLGFNVIQPEAYRSKFDREKDNDKAYRDAYEELVKGDEDSLEAYNSEIEQIDTSYNVVDWLGRPMSIQDFQRLDEVTKRDCIVTRQDGTVVDSDDYYIERLA